MSHPRPAWRNSPPVSRRRLPLLLAVIGVVVIAVSVIAASVVRSSDTATLRPGEHPDVPVVITEPGGLDAGGDEVSVRATAPDGAPVSRRRLPLLLAVIGVVVIAVSVIAASVVRSSDTATLRLGEHPDVPVLITEPGVLDAVDPRVTVRATAQDDAPVVLAVGRTAEVEAWLGDADHARVTGLSSWEELTVEVVTGTEPTDPAEPRSEERRVGQVLLVRRW